MTQSKDNPASTAAAPTLIGADPLSTFRSPREWLHLNRHFWEIQWRALHRPQHYYLQGEPNIARDKALLALATLARVPAENTERLRQFVSGEIDREWYWHSSSEARKVDARKHAVTQLKRVAQLSSELDMALRDLNESAELALQQARHLPQVRDRSSPPPFEPLNECDIAHYRRMTAAFADQSAAALAVRRPQRVKGRPGNAALKRPGEPGSLIRFTLWMLWAVYANDGHLTIDKNSGKGTLIEALNLLRPHLPPKFVPNALPLSTLASIKGMALKVLQNN